MSTTTKEYVQQIPDHCDRIVWRGRYFHLPLQGRSPGRIEELSPCGWLIEAYDGCMQITSDPQYGERMRAHFGDRVTPLYRKDEVEALLAGTPLPASSKKVESAVPPVSTPEEVSP